MHLQKNKIKSKYKKKQSRFLFLDPGHCYSPNGLSYSRVLRDGSMNMCTTEYTDILLMRKLRTVVQCLGCTKDRQC